MWECFQFHFKGTPNGLDDLLVAAVSDSYEEGPGCNLWPILSLILHIFLSYFLFLRFTDKTSEGKASKMSKFLSLLECFSLRCFVFRRLVLHSHFFSNGSTSAQTCTDAVVYIRSAVRN